MGIPPEYTKHRLDLFATPLWRYEYRGSEDLLKKLTEGAYKCAENLPSEKISNQGGYHSKVFDWSKFLPEGQEYINDILNDLLSDKPATSTNIEWWFNINKKDDWNTAHVHPYNQLVLIWYLTDSFNKLKLQHPNAYNRYFLDSMISEDNLNPDIPNDNIRIEANKGDIVIFPADIFHSVMSHDKDEDRVCISMNISFARLVDPDDYVSKPIVLDNQ